MPANVLVTTKRMDRQESEGRQVVVDYDDVDHRKWLGRHCSWAIRHGHSVLSEPTDLPVNFVPKADE